MHITVALFDRSFDDVGFTYFVPDFLQEQIFLGALVLVPFGRNIVYGIVLEIKEKNDNPSKIDIKPVISVIYNFPLLYNYQIELIKWLASNYFSLIHKVLYSFFPRNLIEKIKKSKFSLEEKRVFKYKFNTNKKLSKSQEQVYLDVLNTTKNKIYLFGITGSGKTEIYVNLIKKYLQEEKQILLLVPEIILTSQLSEYLKYVFGDEVVVINSSTPEAQKTNYRVSIYNGNAKIIVGTRSSLFYPYKNLGFIIVDEEHDNSYNSDSSPRFNGIELISKIGDLLNIKVLFASGTPSINHMYKALKSDYKILNLFEEIGKQE